MRVVEPHRGVIVCAGPAGPGIDTAGDDACRSYIRGTAGRFGTP